MNIPKIQYLNKYKITEKHILKNYTEFYSYINEHYPADLTWTEKLYWYYHNINDYPKCPICGRKPEFINFARGYREFCSIKCMRNSEKIIEKTKQTNLKRYGFENAFKNKELQEKQKQTCIERYGVKYIWKIEGVLDKVKQTNLKRYGFENAFKNKELQEKQKQTCIERYGVANISQNDNVKEKKKNTILKHYGVENPNQNKLIKEKVKQTNLKKYGYTSYTKTSEYKEKSYLTKKANHSFNSSKIEEDFSNWLTENNITFKRQYRSDKYPFTCDFYFPDKDLYLEIQGHWSHGGHPYNQYNNGDQLIVEEWKNKHTEYYDNAIQVWTESDPLKRETAKKNGLNWVEAFSCDLNDVIALYKTF